MDILKWDVLEVGQTPSASLILYDKTELQEACRTGHTSNHFSDKASGRTIQSNTQHNRPYTNSKNTLYMPIAFQN